MHELETKTSAYYQGWQIIKLTISFSEKQPQSAITDETCNSEVCANANDVSRCHKKTLAFEAIADLHSQLDGDSSGGIDVSEASLFLGDKLSYPVDQFNQRDLSQEDGIISLLDLWVAWRKNPGSSFLMGCLNSPLMSYLGMTFLVPFLNFIIKQKK
ncbi:Stromal interaction molecule [Echinococcus granulosus]|uniref:Stromal interaction molecule n=1 Tax=Echinococcus granulosus TaxID=6210 RepID=W6UJI1_ECHGR|nr:Stromal interaction molecule [Echinococcus granulosus]EUB61675.1 Stromal interaction molecule [Echinococcus granulosus]